jgi:hypothetical protein
MHTRSHQQVRLALAVVAGLAWTQLSLLLAALVVPPRLALAPRIAATTPYRIAEQTVLAPLSVAARLCSLAGPYASAVRPGFAVALASALVAIGTCTLVALLLGVERLRRPIRLTLAATCAVAVVSAGIVAVQLRDAAVAEHEFFALVRRSATPSADERTVAAAAVFVRQHPLSRWRSEALRIVAMHAWAHGRYAQAQRVWSDFEACFDDPRAPGVAYAEYSRALCFERMGRVRDAIACDRKAIGIIRSRSDGIQAWIAPDAARRIARLERTEGMTLTAAYWNAQSQTLKDVCSIQ